MNFKKDLLLIDLETTGLDATKQEIIQLAAVLLDKKTLKEKKSFDSFVRPTKWKSRDLESMKINKISYDLIKSAPILAQVLTNFNKEFKFKNVIFAYYGGPVDVDFMRAAYRKIGKKFPFDYHYFNLWAVFYFYLATKNKLTNPKKFTGFTLDDFMKQFKITSDNRHNALVDCQVEAEILRRIAKNPGNK